MRRPRQPLWEVVERHFEEAEFLAELWLEGREQPEISPAEPAEGIEARLLAHLDALAVPGPAALERLAWPALERATDRSLALVAGLWVLAVGDERACRRLLVLLGECEEGDERWQGIVDALGLSEREGLQELLVALVESPQSLVAAGVVRASARRRNSGSFSR